jgi:hypothetical protein
MGQNDRIHNMEGTINNQMWTTILTPAQLAHIQCRIFWLVVEENQLFFFPHP